MARPEFRTINGMLIGLIRPEFPRAWLERVPERITMSVGLDGGPGESAAGPKMCDGWKHNEQDDLNRLDAIETEEQYSTSRPAEPPVSDLERDLKRLGSGLPALEKVLRVALNAPEPPPPAAPLFPMGEVRLSKAAATALHSVVNFADLLRQHQAGDFFRAVELTDGIRFCPVLPCFTAAERAAAAVESGQGVVASVWPIAHALPGEDGYRGAYRAVHVVTILGDHTFIFATR